MIWAPLNMADLIQECEYHPSFLTDHQYLLVKCSFHDQIATGPGVWKFNTSLLQDPDYNTLVTSFWAFWQTLSDHPDFASQLDWWDQGKFYLREITCSFSKAKAVRERNRKTFLNKQLRELQRLFEAGDHAAFCQLCAVQQDFVASPCMKPVASPCMKPVACRFVPAANGPRRVNALPPF